MIWQRHNKRGKWHVYLCSIPSTYSVPVLFESGEMTALASTCLAHKAELQRAKLRLWFEDLVPAVTQEFPETFPPEVFTWENFLWAYAAYSSRAFPRWW